MDKLNNENKPNCFFEKYGNDFDGYYNDPHIRKIMAKSASRFRHSFDEDESNSIQAEWLWHSIRKYDKNKATKFSSYLFGQVAYGFRIKLKERKKRTNFVCLSAYSDSNPDAVNEVFSSMDGFTLKNCNEVKDFMMDLPPDLKSILNQRFFHKMTMEEIGAKNGYSRETARRKINSAIEFCKGTF